MSHSTPQGALSSAFPVEPPGCSEERPTASVKAGRKRAGRGNLVAPSSSDPLPQKRDACSPVSTPITTTLSLLTPEASRRQWDSVTKGTEHIKTNHGEEGCQETAPDSCYYGHTWTATTFRANSGHGAAAVCKGLPCPLHSCRKTAVRRMWLNA